MLSLVDKECVEVGAAPDDDTERRARIYCYPTPSLAPAHHSLLCLLKRVIVNRWRPSTTKLKANKQQEPLWGWQCDYDCDYNYNYDDDDASVCVDSAANVGVENI